MSLLTYRVLVTGKFDRPDQATRARLVAKVDQHGLLQAKFTEDGTLAYSAHLGAFAFRCVVHVEPGAMADQDAADEAQLKAIEHLEAAGWPFRDLTAATTCMDDIKIKRRF